MDPTTQTVIGTIITTLIATSGIVAVAVINNQKERGRAADAGVDAAVDANFNDREVLKLVGELTAENARKEATIQSRDAKIRRLESKIRDLETQLTTKGGSP